MTMIILDTPEGKREVKSGERIYSIERRYEFYEPVILVVTMRADFTGYKLARKANGMQSPTRAQAEIDQAEVAKGQPVYYQASQFEITTE